MANIVVTTIDANHIKVEFNDYYPNPVSYSVGFYNRNFIEEVRVYDDYVRVHMVDSSQDWFLASSGTAGLIIDDIDGTTSWTDLTDLAADIAALMTA